MQQKTGAKPLENADNSYNFNMENKGKKSVFLKKNDVNHIIMIHIIIIVTYLLRRKIKFYIIFFIITDNFLAKSFDILACPLIK